ncbi:hypothetical protein GBF38_008167 [Nibea albiflora]|uniref:Uncharacterized protein n=1 Tax=Nibea albiflora TaxID=240163 RepID=A0ACB7EQF3_NIBAL|nr:hypothetical protein GBF38_008167 [Nibea albiflora]
MPITVPVARLPTPPLASYTAAAPTPTPLLVALLLPWRYQALHLEKAAMACLSDDSCCPSKVKQQATVCTHVFACLVSARTGVPNVSERVHDEASKPRDSTSGQSHEPRRRWLLKVNPTKLHMDGKEQGIVRTNWPRLKNDQASLALITGDVQIRPTIVMHICKPQLKATGGATEMRDCDTNNGYQSVSR